MSRRFRSRSKSRSRSRNVGHEALQSAHLGMGGLEVGFEVLLYLGEADLEDVRADGLEGELEEGAAGAKAVRGLLGVLDHVQEHGDGALGGVLEAGGDFEPEVRLEVVEGAAEDGVAEPLAEDALFHAAAAGGIRDGAAAGEGFEGGVLDAGQGGLAGGGAERAGQAAVAVFGVLGLEGRDGHGWVSS
jgi:hypothetical protein